MIPISSAPTMTPNIEATTPEQIVDPKECEADIKWIAGNMKRVKSEYAN